MLGNDVDLSSYKGKLLLIVNVASQCGLTNSNYTGASCMTSTKIKVDVNGEKAAPMYKFLKSSKGGFFSDSIKWNFSKFLVDKLGNVIDRYAPITSPVSIEKDIV